MVEASSRAARWEAPCLFCGLGAIAWAIRGTDGWGGFDGAVLPGMLWALLMYWYMGARDVQAGWACFMYGLGISIGGMWGYGVYVPWIQGTFVVGATSSLAINPLVGYWWMLVTGVAWGAPAAVLFCWAAWKTGFKGWLIRLLIPAASCLVVFPIRAFIPDAIYPFHSTGLYELGCISCERAIETTTVNLVVVLWLAGALLAELLLRHVQACKLVLLTGACFGASFALFSSWCLLYGTSDFTDWWKAWELSMGIGGGACTFVFTRWCVRFSRGNGLPPGGNPRPGTMLAALSFYGVALYGATSRLGVVLGLYPDGFVQYDLPPARLVLVVALLVPFLLLFITRARRGAILGAGPSWVGTSLFTGFIGIATIWPSNLVIAYFLLVWLAIAPVTFRTDPVMARSRPTA